jgi:hypothetical protein
MFNLRSLAGAAATVAIVLVAGSCDTQREPLGPTIGPPSFHFGAPLFCISFKMTGGGRIDYPPGTGEKNPPPSRDFQTFGAHVIASAEEVNGECLLEVKGSLQWVDHSIRIDGRPLTLHSIEITFAETFDPDETFDCEDGSARWGGKLVLRNTGEDYDFEVFDCDNGEPGRGRDGFGIRVTEDEDGNEGAVFYQVLCPNPALPPAEPSCTLTGGNRQFHETT